MNSIDKIGQLRTVIHDSLSPLITSDYWLLNVPYHGNVGDALIWQGEVDFLNALPYRCKGTTSYNISIPKDIKKDDIILIHGGGNFGDLWDIPMKYQMSIVQQYPNNKIIFFPQTVWFEHRENMIECLEILAKHNNITICVRDKVSLDKLQKNFKNNILLVPDMAFYIDMRKWKRPVTGNKALLLKRGDREQKSYAEIEELIARDDITICDWLPFTDDCWQKNWLRRTMKYMPFIHPWYAEHIYLPYMVKSGIQLIGSHDKIYSTRLHAAILSILLGKEKDLTWFDNSYGKNFNFYDAWLKDVDGITFVK